MWVGQERVLKWGPGDGHLTGPSRAGTGAAGRPDPASSAKCPVAQGGAPRGASAQGAWEGDSLEPALIQRQTRRLGELARSSAPCPGNRVMGLPGDPPVPGMAQGMASIRNAALGAHSDIAPLDAALQTGDMEMLPDVTTALLQWCPAQEQGDPSPQLPPFPAQLHSQ